MATGLRIGTTAALALLAWAAAARPQDANQRNQQIRRLDQKARSEEQQGHPDVAIQKYKEIVALDPASPAAYNNLGRLYYEQGRFQEAIAPLKRAAELGPKLEAPRAQLGFCFFQMADFASARQEFQSALKLDPTDSLAKLFLARSLFELNDAKGALKLLEPLRQEDPNNVEVLFSLGWVYAALAVSNLEAIQKADPGSYLIDVLQGKYAEARQAFPEAAERYKRALAKSPRQPDLCYDYAHALWASGDFAGSLEAYRRALELNPSDYRASWEAARVALLSDPQEALRLANRALELKPEIAGALTVRGRARLALGKPAEAVEDFKKASALEPSNSANYFQLARAYGQLGKTVEANAASAAYDRLERQAHAAPVEDAPSAPH
jgi:tetratricopeptide (TPR) repeat protein